MPANAKMPAKPYTALSIAVGSGKIGYAFFVDDELCDWGLSVKASKTTERAIVYAKKQIEFYAPDLIVTERLTLHTRKRGQTVKNIEAIEKVAQAANSHHVDVIRVQNYANKHEEALALAQRYPVIADWVPPKRKIWQSENEKMVLFEAISLIERS